MESLILYAWLKGRVNIETCVDVLESNLKLIEAKKEEEKRAIDGFTALLNIIKEKIGDELDRL